MFLDTGVTGSALLLLVSCLPNCPKPCYYMFLQSLKTSFAYYSKVIASFSYLQNLKQILQ